MEGTAAVNVGNALLPTILADVTWTIPRLVGRHELLPTMLVGGLLVMGIAGFIENTLLPMDGFSV